MIKKLIVLASAVVIVLSASGCAMMFPGLYPSYYYDAGYCPWVDGVWIVGPYHGHSGHWAHRNGYVNYSYHRYNRTHR